MRKKGNVVTSIAQGNLQMGKIANAVPRTAVEGRYRGKRNSTLTKTYKRHLLTIMAGMGMFNIIYSKNSPSSTGGR